METACDVAIYLPIAWFVADMLLCTCIEDLFVRVLWHHVVSQVPLAQLYIIIFALQHAYSGVDLPRQRWKKLWRVHDPPVCRAFDCTLLSIAAIIASVASGGVKGKAHNRPDSFHACRYM